MKKILIIGGTHFIGRYLVERLLSEDRYDLSLFHRGLTNKDLFPSVNRIFGDRYTDDIKQIKKKNWDIVVDLSCYYPKGISESLKCLNELENYIFISTCSVYDNDQYSGILRNEDAPILSCTKEEAIDSSDESYGQRKAECERILKASRLPYTILRPALVFGKYDTTDRMYYWLNQMKKNELLVLPESGKRNFSLTDVSDLVESILYFIHNKAPNQVYNAISYPKASLRMVIDSCREIIDSSSKEMNVDPNDLHQNNIRQWVDVPLWLDTDDYTYSNKRLRQETGIQERSFDSALKETIEYFDLLDWPDAKYGWSNSQKNTFLSKL